MPENDFEKQVQQKMDELQFVPSDAVWPEVERQIEQRKKRRGVFFWLPFGVLLLGGAAWIYFSGVENAGTKKETTDQVIAKASAGNKNKNVDTSATTNATINDIRQAETLKDNASVQATKKTATDAGSVEVNKNEITTDKKSISTKGQKNKSAVASTIEPASANMDEKIAGQKYKTLRKTYNPNPVVKKTGTKEKSIPAIDANEETTVAAASATETKDNDTAQSSQKKDDVASAEPVKDSIVSKDPVLAKETGNDKLKHINKTDSTKSVAKTKTTNKTKKKIEWGININAGVSSISDGFSSLFSSTRSYDASTFSGNQQSVAPGNINTGALSNVVTKPSEIKPGFSYAAGMFVNIPLDKKFNLLTGINYTYYSNSLKAGAKSDSTGTVYYALGNLNSYTNRFHFIEIPVSVQMHTARFAVNGGLSFSMLAGTNALLYNAQGKYYYNDKSLINKVQVGLLAGVSYRLFPKTMPIEIGPQINYNLTSIFNKDLYGSRHLLFTGINAKFYLHKK